MRKKRFIMTILALVIAFSMLPSAALAEVKSETCTLHSKHYTSRCYYDYSKDMITLNADYSIDIEPRDDTTTIIKVELNGIIHNGLSSVDQIMSSKGVVSGDGAPGSSIVIDNIYSPSLQITVPKAEGGQYLDFNDFTIYYDDTPGKDYAGTATPVSFNGLEWYITQYDADENTAVLLARDCVGVSAYISATIDYRDNKYKNSTVESYVKQYYNDHFSAVDSAVVPVIPQCNGYDSSSKQGNEAKLWVPSVDEVRKLPTEIKKCTKIEGGDDDFWWLRDTGIGGWQAYRVSYSGNQLDGFGDIEKVRGVRPALKLDLTKVCFVDETKTFRLKSSDDVHDDDPVPAATPVPQPEPTEDPIQAYVQRCYKNILNREGEEEGVAYWTNLLKTRTATGAEIVRGFVNSPEFTGRGLSNEEIVEIFYRAMLGREPEEGGFAFWLGALNEGYGVDYLVWGFSNSPEFEAICATYGIEAGNIPMPVFTPATAETNALLTQPAEGDVIPEQLPEEPIALPEETAEEEPATEIAEPEFLPEEPFTLEPDLQTEDLPEMFILPEE